MEYYEEAAPGAAHEQEQCLICLRLSPGEGGGGRSSSSSSSSQTWKEFPRRPGEPPALTRNVVSIFLLRHLLGYPKEECSRLLTRTFGVVEPGNWVILCGRCSGLVRSAFELHLEMLRLSRQVAEVGAELRSELGRSFDENEAHHQEQDWNHVEILNVQSIIREYFKGDKSSLAPQIKMKTMMDGLGVIPEPEYSIVKEEYVEAILYSQEDDGGGGGGGGGDHSDPLNIPLGGGNYNYASGNIANWSTLERSSRRHANTNAGTTSTSNNSLMEWTSPEDFFHAETDETSSINGMATTTTTMGTSSGGRVGMKYQCNLCPFECQLQLKFRSHAEAHSAFPDFSCPVCNYPSRCQKSRTHHIQRSHPGAVLRCGQCESFETTSPPLLYSHEREHKFTAAMGEVEPGNPETLLRCSFCGEAGSWATLCAHMKGNHLAQLGIEHHACATCGAVFFTRGTLNVHFKKVHGGGGGDPNNPADLLEDIKPKLNLINLETTMMKKKKKNMMKRKRKPKFHGPPPQHQNSSSNPQVSVCKVCGVEVVPGDVKTLSFHMSTAHPELSIYACAHCDAAFRNKPGLETHVQRIHSIGKPTCDWCGREMNSTKYLYTHKKKYCGMNPAKRGGGGGGDGGEI